MPKGSDNWSGRPMKIGSSIGAKKSNNNTAVAAALPPPPPPPPPAAGGCGGGGSLVPTQGSQLNPSQLAMAARHPGGLHAAAAHHNFQVHWNVARGDLGGGGGGGPKY